MGEGDSDRRKESFNEVADLYDRHRPGYPEKVVAALTRSADIVPGRQVLEIGCGTGQISVPLAKAGAHLTAIELGPALAAIARRNLAPYPSVRVEVAAFEDWPVPTATYDAVVCANAFHWLDPEVRYAKAARALRPGGMLAILSVDWVRGGTPGFTRATQRCYMRYGLGGDPDFELPAVSEVPEKWTDFDGRPEFTDVCRARIEDSITYLGGSYADMLSTQSNVNSLGEEARAGFLDCMRRLVLEEFGGEVTRRYLYHIVCARRR